MSKETITLDNFADWHGSVNGVEIRSHLPLEPYVPSTEINVHLGRISRAAKFGHLGAIAFRRHTADQSSITPGIDSVAEDGSATASFSATASKSPRIESEFRSDRPFLSATNSKGRGKVDINFGHEDLNEVNLRKPGAWANYLDTTISDGLRECSNRQFSATKLRRLFLAAVFTWGPILDLANHDGAKAIEDYAYGLGIYNSLGMAVNSTESEFTLLVPGIPFDRIGFVQAYTHSRKFVDTK